VSLLFHRRRVQPTLLPYTTLFRSSYRRRGPRTRTVPGTTGRADRTCGPWSRACSPAAHADDSADHGQRLRAQPRRGGPRPPPDAVGRGRGRWAQAPLRRTVGRTAAQRDRARAGVRAVRARDRTLGDRPRPPRTRTDRADREGLRTP